MATTKTATAGDYACSWSSNHVSVINGNGLITVLANYVRCYNKNVLSLDEFFSVSNEQLRHLRKLFFTISTYCKQKTHVHYTRIKILFYFLILQVFLVNHKKRRNNSMWGQSTVSFHKRTQQTFLFLFCGVRGRGMFFFLFSRLDLFFSDRYLS